LKLAVTSVPGRAGTNVPFPATYEPRVQAVPARLGAGEGVDPSSMQPAVMMHAAAMTNRDAATTMVSLLLLLFGAIHHHIGLGG
jgi:hypothetical protein